MPPHPATNQVRWTQQPLFPDRLTRRRELPVIGQQKDIRYIGSRARAILNPPERTGMPFWSINPYVGCALGCAYCYARYAHGYVADRAAAANPLRPDLQPGTDDLPPWLAFERRVFVKENAADVLRRTLRHGSARHQALARGEWMTIGTATDPYQPAERHFRVTRSILEVLAEHEGLGVSVITKSPLITRDIDLLVRIARRSSVRLHVSLISTDRELARRIEPRAPTPEARLRAIARLAGAGLHVTVNVMPILPGITDGPAQLDALVSAIAATGAQAIGACALRLRSAARQRYLPWVAQEFPELAARYHATYVRDHRTGERYRRGLSRVMGRLCARHGIAYGTYDDGVKRQSAEAVAPADPVQLDLELPVPLQ
jgi:DNA repair photolyase